MKKKTEIHLVNPMLRIGGSELRTIHLYRLLSKLCSVTIWTEFQPTKALGKLAPIRRIQPVALRFPKRGTFVFVGAYFNVGRWLRFAKPARTILVYNINNRKRLEKALGTLSLGGKRTVELVYSSAAIKSGVGLPGIIEDSPIDLDAFSPCAGKDATPFDAADEFVIGRASRDDPLKYAENDPALYKKLAELGFRIRIAGGTCLHGLVQKHSRIELQPLLSPLEFPAFLRGLNCFIYRTSREWREAYGRVIAEAMACGLPVILARNIGIAQHIVHGVNGFLADTDDEITAILFNLRSDPALCSRIGAAARLTMEQLYSGSRLDAIAKFYLEPPVLQN